MLCAALGFVVFGVNKNKTAHLVGLEEALAGKTKKGGESTSVSQLTCNVQTEAALEAQNAESCSTSENRVAGTRPIYPEQEPDWRAHRHRRSGHRHFERPQTIPIGFAVS